MSTASYAQFKRVENTRVARERDRRRGRELAALAAAIIPVALALFAYTRFHLQTVQAGYSIDRDRRTVARLLEERQKLLSRLAAATAPSRTARYAAGAGFVPPRTGQIYAFVAAGAPSSAAPPEPSTSTPPEAPR
ncbi:MAG TPA: hypothetical protein VFL12_06455 [Thermoanaerobaculia bacterium]|nr:hypothetical protein [Thermoanaerobaculia bacterium]